MERICKFNLSGQFLRYLSLDKTHIPGLRSIIPGLGNSSYSFENKSRSIALWILDGSSLWNFRVNSIQFAKKIYLNSRSLSKIRVFFPFLQDDSGGERKNFEKGSSPTGKSSSGSESPKPGRRRFGSTADEIGMRKMPF